MKKLKYVRMVVQVIDTKKNRIMINRAKEELIKSLQCIHGPGGVLKVEHVEVKKVHMCVIKNEKETQEESSLLDKSKNLVDGQEG